jgi:hypothetical protein
VGQTEDEIVNDMQAVREAENRLRSCAGDWRLFPYPTAPDDMKTLADAYLSLTDPTPLTVELLVDVGGECVGDDGIRFGDLYFTICEVDGIIGVMVGEEHLPRKLWPRTVGHLRQLLLRMEGQS